MQPLVIAIDGPSGSGKSSTSKLVAARLGLAYLDTGSMYRAVALGAMNAGILDDPDAVVDLARQAKLDVGTSPSAPAIAVDGVDVTAEIRDPQVSASVSKVAVIPQVREILTAQMQRIVADAKAGIVLEGRDATTVITPDAPVRVLLVADTQARMARRNAEIGGLSQVDLTDQVVRRDRDDATVAQFEAPAPGVRLIDTTHLTLDQAAEAVIALAAAATG